MPLPKTRPDLDELIRQAVARVKAMSPEERQRMYDAQRLSWVRAELCFGSDADEARWRAASPEERKRLDAEAKVRADEIMRRYANPA